MQNFDFLVSPGSTFAIACPGNYFKYRSGTAGGSDPTITLQCGRNGGKVTVAPGAALTRERDFNDWTITNTGAQAIAGTVTIGHGRIDDTSIAGTVAVVDGAKSRTLTGSAFAGYAAQSAVASQYSRLALWNPATNANRLVVEQIMYAGGSTGSMSGLLCLISAPLTTINEQGKNKLAGAADSVAQLQNDSSATGATASMNIFPTTGVGDRCFYVPHEPYVLRPGYGLALISNVPAMGSFGNFEWYEELNQ